MLQRENEVVLQGENENEARERIPTTLFDFPLINPRVEPIPEPLIDPHVEPIQEATSPLETPSIPPEEKMYGKVYSRRPTEIPALPTSTPMEIVEMAGKTSEPSDNDLPIALRKQPRSCTNHPISRFVSYSTLSRPFRAFTTNLDRTRIPTNIGEALASPQWRKAVMEEINALEKNGTWEITELPKNKKPVGCKWVFTIKYKSDGTIERYKARLVAKGFTQTYGIDYTETFAPVAKLNTVRILLSLAANLDWPLHQLDIKNAFLNGDLDEEVYMTIPPGFEKSNKGQVCKLMKSLYGLKQSPRAWFDRFTTEIKRQGYQQAQSDHTMFFYYGKGKRTILIVYVDDIVITGEDPQEIERIKSEMAKSFEVKDLGQMRYFLGMEVARSKLGISVSQRKYILDLLEETGMLGCKPINTPIESGKRVDGGNSVDKERYQKLVGKLIYLSHTRPNIAFAVSVVSQHMHATLDTHMEAVYRILRYLKGSPGKGLFFKKCEGQGVEIYTDADRAGSQSDRRSTTGYCTFVWGNLVTWRSKKQTVVARSTTEAEFRAVAQGMCEALWIKKLLEELKIFVQLPMRQYCDNKAAISISLNPVQHDRTKHVEIDRHFIKEKIENKYICLTYVPTKEQLGDIFTKGLPLDMFEKITSKLDMINICDPT